MMVSYKADHFQAELSAKIRGECADDSTCFLMDFSAMILVHPLLANSPADDQTPDEASARRARRAGAEGGNAQPSSTRQPPAMSGNAAVFVGDMHGAVAQEMLSLGLLLQRTTRGLTPNKNGMAYDINVTMLDVSGGEIQGIVTRPDLAKFVVRKIPGSNVLLVVIRDSGGKGNSHRKDYCGVFSTDCPDLIAPWPADLGESASVEQLASECNTILVAPRSGGARMCPVPAEKIMQELRSGNASSGLRVQLRDLQVQSGQKVCRTWAESNMNYIIFSCVVAVVAMVVAVVLHVQASKLARRELQETRDYRDVLHQPVKEIAACAELVRQECHNVIGAARSFYDFQYLIEVLEREAVNLLVRKNRCQLRHQNIELQAIKDLMRVLKADMHSIHLRTSRLEAAAAEFEEAEHLFPQYQVRAQHLRARLDQLVKHDNEDTDYTLTNTVDFYASHHPDIFGADLTDADTSAVNTPRSTLMGGMLADDTSYVHHTARSNGSRSVRMLAPREMPVHAGVHARRARAERSERSEAISARVQGQRSSAHGAGDMLDVRAAEEAAAAVQTPRLPYTPAGATEHRVQHFMKLAAARDRDRVLTHGISRQGAMMSRGLGQYGLPPLAEGMDSTDMDLTDEESHMHLRRHVKRIRQGAEHSGNGWNASGPTASERGRVLAKLDAHGNVADTYTEAADLTESRWDDTAHDLLSTNMDDATQLGPGSMIEEGDETRAGFESDDDQDAGRLEEELDVPRSHVNGHAHAGDGGITVQSDRESVESEGEAGGKSEHEGDSASDDIHSNGGERQEGTERGGDSGNEDYVREDGSREDDSEGVEARDVDLNVVSRTYSRPARAKSLALYTALFCNHKPISFGMISGSISRLGSVRVW